ncbi:MAG: hypothetical protein II072_00980, partial [Clostridia bacterium]|nr:hypothetical protein [Clostridia bacterium]
MKNFKKLVSLLLAFVLVFAAIGVLPAGAFSVNEAEADSDFDGIPDIFDSAPNSNTFTGRMKSGHDGTTAVSYTMDFRNFFTDNTVYHPELASVSVLGSALAYFKA